MKQPIVSIQEPRAGSALLIQARSLSIPFELFMPFGYTSECGWRGAQSLGQALSLRVYATSSAILPMISRGFWLFEGTESRYKGIAPP